MTDQNSAAVNMTRPEDLQAKYNIGKDAYYARLKFLEIKAQKDSEKKAYLTNEQVELLDALHSHIEKTGKMEGFNSSSLVKVDDSSIEQSAERIEVNSNQPNQDQFMALVRNAAEFAAGMEIAKYSLAKQIQDNPDLMPEDLKEHVEKAKGACIPKSQSPTAIADQFLTQYRKIA